MSPQAFSGLSSMCPEEPAHSALIRHIEASEACLCHAVWDCTQPCCARCSAGPWESKRGKVLIVLRATVNPALSKCVVTPILLNPPTNFFLRSWYSHLTGEETETQHVNGIFQRSYSSVVKLGSLHAFYLCIIHIIYLFTFQIFTDLTNQSLK